jgi:hypothetical protein
MYSNKKKTIWLIGSAGLAWNLYGVYQFLQSVLSTKESMLSMGMSEVQAQLMSSYPIWMDVAFAVGTFGGTLGCILLLMKNKFTKSVFLTSLIGYVALFIGDITEGVFAALGAQQVVILSLVLLIAAGLFYYSAKIEKEILT